MKSIHILIAVFCFAILRTCNGAYTRQVFTSSDCSDATMIGQIFYPGNSGPSCTQNTCFQIVNGFYGLENCVSTVVTYPNDWSGVFSSSSDICETADAFVAGKPNVCWPYTSKDSYKVSGCNQDTSVTFQYSQTSDCSTNDILSNISSCASLGTAYFKKVMCYDVPAVPVADPAAAPVATPTDAPVMTPSASPVASTPVANNTPKAATTPAKKNESTSLISGSVTLVVLAAIAALY